MCKFFSLVTEPEGHPNQRFYFDWEYRKAHLKDDDADSHDHIIKHFNLPADKCNKWEYNPLTGEFEIDQINSEIDDRVQVEEWARNLDFKKVVEPLIVKPIVHPFKIRAHKVTTADVELLKQWASVWASVRDSVWASVRASVRDSVGDSVWDSVGASVRDSVWDSVRGSVRDSVRDSVGGSVWDSVWDSVWAYTSSFFDIKYDRDFSPAVKLWERGIVPSFDGTTWRLHAGKGAKIVYEIKASDLHA